MKLILFLFFQICLCEQIKNFIIKCLDESNICIKKDVNKFIFCLKNEIKLINLTDENDHLTDKNDYLIDESEINLFCEYQIYVLHKNLFENKLSYINKNLIDNIIIEKLPKSEFDKTNIIIIIISLLFFILLCMN